MREYIKEKGLIPMVDFVFEALERCESTLDFQSCVLKYAQFNKILVSKKVLEIFFDCFEFEKINYFIHVFSKHQASYNREEQREIFKLSLFFKDLRASSFITYRQIYDNKPIYQIEDLLMFGYKVTLSEKGLNFIFNND